MESQNRSSRVGAKFPVTYLSEADAEFRIEGNCLNISESGLLGEFAEALEIWTRGELLLHFGGGTLGIKVRVARVSENQAGFVFLFENPEQERTVAQAVASASLDMEQKGHNVGIPF